jgi:hypothetical protein
MKFVKLALRFGVAAALFLSASQTTAQSQSSGGPAGGQAIPNVDQPAEPQRRPSMPPVEMKSDKPPLRLTPAQRTSIVDAIAQESTYQRTPKGFEPSVGITVKSAIKLNPMPRPLIYEIPVLRQYAYAKLERNILIVDPMSKKVLYVIPRKWPTAGTKGSPGEWAATRGRELVGLEPTATTGTTDATIAQSDIAHGASREQLRQSLEKAGFKDVTIVNEAYVVNAKTSDGPQVVLFVSPSASSARGAVGESRQEPPKR